MSKHTPNTNVSDPTPSITHPVGMDYQVRYSRGDTFCWCMLYYVRVITASVRLVYRGKVRCSDTLRTGSDETRQDHPDEIEVRTDRMGHVKSDQVRYTQCYACSALRYITYNALCISAESEYSNACVRGQARPNETRPS